MTRCCPAASDPSAQGNTVVQAPLFETNVSPVGVGSLTVTFSAVAGPLLVTVMV